MLGCNVLDWLSGLAALRTAMHLSERAAHVLKTVAGLRFRSLCQRITATHAVLLAIVVAILVSLSSSGLDRFAEASARRDLAANARVFDEILAGRALQMGDLADALAHDLSFRKALAAGDIMTIAKGLESAQLGSSNNKAFVLKLGGEILATDEAFLPDAKNLLVRVKAGASRGLIAQPDGFAQAVVVPIEVPDLLGWLVITRPLDGTELERLTELAAIPIEARLAESTSQPAWLPAVRIGGAIEHGQSERFLYHASELEALEEGISPRLLLRYSLAHSNATYAGLNWLYLAFALGGVGLSLFLSWRVARGLSERLYQLDEATRMISQGHEVALAIDTYDEIGRLAQSFTTMAAAIKDRERQITHLGLHDGLTGLPNRKLFNEQLANVLSRRRDGEQVMCAYVDLDDFKIVNDTLGHPAGDALLRMLADHVREDLSDALIARLGGDEFAIFVDGIGADGSLVRVAERLMQAFSRTLVINGQHARCGASIGIAVAPNDGNDVDTLIKNADLALYRAKYEGKDAYHFFESSLDEAARTRRQLEIDLRKAITSGGFELKFQPLYCVAERSLTGFEALIRWNHPDRGQIKPEAFIALAEETGLIVPIGEWVIREACHHASTWPDGLTVSVNVSPKQFAASGLSSAILQALSSSGLAPHRLELEITERTFSADIDATLATLNRLRSIGVRIALDDFGTGYLSLSCLKSFPFDKLKIDRSFVEDLGTSVTGHAIIRAITTLADALGMETLAEGVEDHEQLEVLAREGCRHVQGYLFSKPVSAAEVANLVDGGEPSTGRRFGR